MKRIIYILSLAIIIGSCGNNQEKSKQESSVPSSSNTSEVIDESENLVDNTSASTSNDLERSSEAYNKESQDLNKSVISTVVSVDDPEEDIDLEMLKKGDGAIASTQEAVVGEVVVEIEHPPVNDYNFHAYEKFNSLLKTYVSNAGKVNYKGIKGKKEDLAAIVKEFQGNTPAPSWSSSQKLVYWINAYNLFTLQLIVDNYPTTSITKITAKPWDKKFIQLEGKTYSLNNIENDIIRARYNEPRIHFAVNCASESCPVLLNKAFTPSNLYGLLTSQTKRFLNDTSKNNFEGKEIKISKIFDWYKADFTKKGTVIDFINKYRINQLEDPKIGYLDYSWELND